MVQAVVVVCLFYWPTANLSDDKKCEHINIKFNNRCLFCCAARVTCYEPRPAKETVARLTLCYAYV